MANIVRATVEIRGTRPLLQHMFGPDALPLEKQERTGIAGNDPEEWKRTAMLTEEGQMYVLSTYIFSTACKGAKHTKRGKGSIQPLVAATLQIEEERVLLDRWLPKPGPTTDPTQPVYIDVAGVRNPTTKARNVRYRLAAGAGWKAKFTILGQDSRIPGANASGPSRCRYPCRPGGWPHYRLWAFRGHLIPGKECPEGDRRVRFGT